jgi:hypothetical protein
MKLPATLTGPRGAQADAPVTSLFSTTQFGTPARLVALGSVTTDTTGTATLVLGGDVDHQYRRTATGPQEYIATSAKRRRSTWRAALFEPNAPMKISAGYFSEF